MPLVKTALKYTAGYAAAAMGCSQVGEHVDKADEDDDAEDKDER